MEAEEVDSWQVEENAQNFNNHHVARVPRSLQGEGQDQRETSECLDRAQQHEGQTPNSDDRGVECVDTKYESGSQDEQEANGGHRVGSDFDGLPGQLLGPLRLVRAQVLSDQCGRSGAQSDSDHDGEIINRTYDVGSSQLHGANAGDE